MIVFKSNVKELILHLLKIKNITAELIEKLKTLLVPELYDFNNYNQKEVQAESRKIIADSINSTEDEIILNKFCENLQEKKEFFSKNQGTPVKQRKLRKDFCEHWSKLHAPLLKQVRVIKQRIERLLVHLNLEMFPDEYAAYNACKVKVY